MNDARTWPFLPSLVLAARLVCAQDNPPPGPLLSPAAAAKTRALKLACAPNLDLPNRFTGDTSAGGGPGVVGVYEFLLSPRSALHRGGTGSFSGPTGISELFVYGCAQALPPRAIASAVVVPYLQYGSCKRIARQRGRKRRRRSCTTQG